MLSLDPDSVYVPPVAGSDLKEAVKATPSSVSPAELKAHAAWTKKFRFGSAWCCVTLSCTLRHASSPSMCAGAAPSPLQGT